MQRKYDLAPSALAPNWVSMLLDDCEPHEKLDYLVRDAAKFFKVPIAMVNLLTTETVVFKACIGQLKGDSLEREGSFCDVAISQPKPLLIVDASKDQKFKEYLLVTNELQIRSYLGKSLHAPDGTRIGTFCLLDNQPREYSNRDQKLLCEFASAAEAEIKQILKSLSPRTSGLRQLALDPKLATA